MFSNYNFLWTNQKDDVDKGHSNVMYRILPKPKLQNLLKFHLI